MGDFAVVEGRTEPSFQAPDLVASRGDRRVIGIARVSGDDGVLGVEGHERVHPLLRVEQPRPPHQTGDHHRGGRDGQQDPVTRPLPMWRPEKNLDPWLAHIKAAIET